MSSRDPCSDPVNRAGKKKKSSEAKKEKKKKKKKEEEEEGRIQNRKTFSQRPSQDSVLRQRKKQG